MPKIHRTTTRPEGAQIMKRTALRTRKVPVTPSDPRVAAPWDDFDTSDDRVSESLFDYEDEREAVEVLVQRTIRTVN